MKKIFNICLLLVLAACQKNNTLETKRFSLQEENEKVSISVAMDYPQKGEGIALPEIRQQVVEFLLPEYKGNLDNADAILKQFAQAENKDLQPEEDLEYSFKATYSGSVDLIAQNPKFVTFVYDSYVFTGGAHGMSFWQAKTISKSNGKLINGNILNDKANTAEFKPLLKQGLNAYFTAQKGAVYQCDFQEADLKDEVFGEYNVNNLPLPLSKPFLTDNGVGFAYLPYEISWYANGRISFVLPYEIMKPYLTPEALDFVAGYNNKNVSAQAYVDEQTQADYQKYKVQSEHKKCAE